MTVFFFAPALLIITRMMLRALGFNVLSSSPFLMRYENGSSKPTIYWRRRTRA